MSQYYIWGTGTFSHDKMNGNHADLICVIDDKARWNILRAYQLVENFPKNSDVMVQIPCDFYIPAISEELKEDIGDGWELVIRKDNPWPAREPLALSSTFKIVPTMQQNVCLVHIQRHIFSLESLCRYTRKVCNLLRTST